MFQLNRFTDCWHVVWLIIQTWSSHAIDSRYSLRLWCFYFSLNNYICYLPPTLVSASFVHNCVTRSTSLCQPSRGDQHLVRDRVCFAKPTWRVGESKCTGATFESDQMRKTFPQFHFSRRGQKLGRKKQASLFCHLCDTVVAIPKESGLTGACKKVMKGRFSVSLLRRDSFPHCALLPSKRRRRWWHAPRWARDGQVRDTQICVSSTPLAEQYKHTMKEGKASLSVCPGGWLRSLGNNLYCQGNTTDWRRRVLKEKDHQNTFWNVVPACHSWRGTERAGREVQGAGLFWKCSADTMEASGDVVFLLLLLEKCPNYI